MSISLPSENETQNIMDIIEGIIGKENIEKTENQYHINTLKSYLNKSFNISDLIVHLKCLLKFSDKQIDFQKQLREISSLLLKYSKQSNSIANSSSQQFTNLTNLTFYLMKPSHLYELDLSSFLLIYYFR